MDLPQTWATQQETYSNVLCQSDTWKISVTAIYWFQVFTLKILHGPPRLHISPPLILSTLTLYNILLHSLELLIFGESSFLTTGEGNFIIRKVHSPRGRSIRVDFEDFFFRHPGPSGCKGPAGTGVHHSVQAWL